MEQQHYNVKLSPRFYILSVLSGAILGMLIAFPLADIVADEKASLRVDSGDYNLSSYEEYSAYHKAVEEAERDAFATMAPILVACCVAFFVVLFVLIGRKRQPAVIDADGMEVWSWFGRKRHRWTDLLDRNAIRVRSGGIGVARFEQFHFTTGSASVNTKRLVNGKEVLNMIEEHIGRQ